jgi:SAM-dependent methyltransferase
MADGILGGEGMPTDFGSILEGMAHDGTTTHPADTWALHWTPRPTDAPPTFAPGERAVVKRLGACTVRSVADGVAGVEPRSAATAATVEVPLRSLTRVHERGHVVVAETSEFRLLAATQVCPTDVVVEIGSSYGRATAVLAKHCARVVGIDTSQQLVAEARRVYPTLEFRQFDVIEEPHLLADLAAACTVCFVDIGGNREIEGLLRVLPVVHRVLAPRLVCIKSRELYKAADAHAHARGGLERAARLPDAGAWWAARLAESAASQARPAKRYHNDGCEREGGSRFTQYPLAYVPVVGPDGRQICRFHNYGVCTKGVECRYDHAHCHRCSRPGHVAKNCHDGQDADGRQVRQRQMGEGTDQDGAQADAAVCGTADTE